jgi:hypothetical protein
MSRKKKFKRIFYGLQEPLVAFRWGTPQQQGVVVCRILPLLRVLQQARAREDLHYVDLPPQLMVGQVMNMKLALEEYRLRAEVESIEQVDAYLKALRRQGFACSDGLDLDVLKTAGTVEWEQHRARFQCKETAQGNLLFRISVGTSVQVPAFNTSWLDPQEVCRKAYEYLREQMHGDATRSSLP